MQPAVKPVFKGDSPLRRDALRENLDRACEHVRVAAKYARSKVVVFPEFFLHGFQPGRSNADWIDASLKIDGPELAELGKAARSAGCYVAGMIYEVLDAYPGRFWNTAVIIDPQGEIRLTYRKLYAMTGKTRPGDVYDDYVRRYGGPQSLFPVLPQKPLRVRVQLTMPLHLRDEDAWLELPVLRAPRIQTTGWLILAGMLTGGISGNLIDRLTREPGFGSGQVVDFIQIPF
ncbi:MAG: hypothetical protein EBR51_10730, partial [Gammaproteobacteria bacterium]|nr:hypothetical protein [Gammaproteobacteria bacterium]